MDPDSGQRATLKTKQNIIRVSGMLREVLTLKDSTGKVLHRFLNPIMVEFYPRDVMQVIVGASILAIPVSLTEEVWSLGASLPLLNILGIMALSLLFIGAFVYYNFYRKDPSDHWDQFVKRVLGTYFFSLLVVAVVLTLLQKTPWTTDFLLSFKRAVIVGFPASMSAAVADMLR